MGAVAVERLIAREEALIAALDGQDVQAIEGASRAMRDAVTDLAAQGGWTTGPELGARLIRALRLAEAAGGRLNHLADRNRRRLETLATISGEALPVAYGRAGRLG